MITRMARNAVARLFGLLDGGQAALKDGVRLGKVDAHEFRDCAVGLQLSAPAVRAVQDDRLDPQLLGLAISTYYYSSCSTGGDHLSALHGVN